MLAHMHSFLCFQKLQAIVVIEHSTKWFQGLYPRFGNISERPFPCSLITKANKLLQHGIWRSGWFMVNMKIRSTPLGIGLVVINNIRDKTAWLFGSE
jgi:hypothetical protein